MLKDHSFRTTSPLVAVICAAGLLLAGCQGQTIATAVERDNPLDRSLFEAAESFEKRRDYGAAVSYYRNLYRRNADDIGAIVGLSRGLRHLQQAREAQAILLRGLKKAEKNLDLRAELGKVQLALGKPLKAMETLSLVDAEEKLKRWDIKVALGIAHDRLGMYSQAERQYRMALDISPENAVVMNNYALSLAQSGRMTEAVEILERAASLPEATPRMRQNLALLYAMKGDLASAERYVRRDMPAKIADHNMAYYRQLQSGVRGDRDGDGDGAANDPAPTQGAKLTQMVPNAAAVHKPAELQAAEVVSAEEQPVSGAEKAETPEMKPEMKAETKTTADANSAPVMAEKPTPVVKDTEMAAEAAEAAEAVVKMDAAEAPKVAMAEPEAKIEPRNSPQDTAQDEVSETVSEKAPEKIAEPAMDKPKAAEKLSVAAVETAVETRAGFRLQLGSFKSLNGAETLRGRIMKQHGDLLSGMELVVETVTVPGRGDFFRVNSRPMLNRDAVDETCLRLAIRDVPCLLVRTP